MNFPAIVLALFMASYNVLPTTGNTNIGKYDLKTLKEKFRECHNLKP